MHDDDQKVAHTKRKRAREGAWEESIIIMQTNCHISRSKFAYGIFNARKISLRNPSLSSCLSLSLWMCVRVSQAGKFIHRFVHRFRNDVFLELLPASALYFVWSSVDWVCVFVQCARVWVAHMCFQRALYAKLPNYKKTKFRRIKWSGCDLSIYFNIQKKENWPNSERFHFGNFLLATFYVLTKSNDCSVQMLHKIANDLLHAHSTRALISHRRPSSSVDAFDGLFSKCTSLLLFLTF